LIEACIFDLDGVITDTAEYHYLGWKKMADDENFRFDRSINERLRGVSRRQSLQIILRYNGKQLPEEKMAGLMEKKNEYYRQLLEEITEEGYLPGIKNLIIALRKRGIKTAIASASKNAQMVIKNLKGEKLFDLIADGHSVERTKPAPDLFLYTAEKLGVSPSKSVVFEDAEAGIIAAIAGGFLCVGIGPEDRVGKATIRFLSTNDIQIEQVLKLKH